MPEQLLKNFSIEIQQKLHEQETSAGNLAVYQTLPFGMLLTIDGQVVMSEHDGFFYHEMMAHPALFTHPHPQKIAILGNSFGILQEVLKHPSVNEVWCIAENTQLEEVVSHYFSSLQHGKNDERVSYHLSKPLAWFKQNAAEKFDIIIQGQHSDDYLKEHYQCYYHALQDNGILIEPCQSSLLYFKTLKPLYQHLEQVGFNDCQLLNFPQPSYPSGWRTVMMATKRSTFKRVREKEVFNRQFTTRYYNFDVHKAALVLPEFVRCELGMPSE